MAPVESLVCTRAKVLRKTMEVCAACKRDTTWCGRDGQMVSGGQRGVSRCAVGVCTNRQGHRGCVGL
jgi:hypothetical protein